MNFKGLKLGGWRQFKAVEIEFHPRLTVITGANGAGKTTLLILLSSHYGWRPTMVSTPRPPGSGSSRTNYLSDLWDIDYVMLSDLLAKMQFKCLRIGLQGLRVRSKPPAR